MPSPTRTVGSIVETVNDTVNNLRHEYRSKGLREVCSDTIQIGLFGNLVGAEIAVEQRIEVGKNGEYVCVRHTFTVTCTGFGCSEPSGAASERDLIFDCDHGDITEEGRRAARRQAQAHAEKCRAMPRPVAQAGIGSEPAPLPPAPGMPNWVRPDGWDARRTTA
ncbi:hypothetical protein AB0K53_01040 [Streptomyces tuirus]|uniref:hypothetical protein n=1 Tax=Streptomyces tuirus TaxID=68278 RepID=UPI0034461E21